jgi:hypothetical protein
MTEEAKSTFRAADAADGPARAKPRRKPPRPPRLSDLKEGSDGARRLCALVLEVLAGVRTPTDAAGVLGVSLARYYALEAQALLGLERLGRELERLHREAARQQALLRAQGRAVGIPPPVKPMAKPQGKKRRPRRPAVRALRAAKALGVSPAQSTDREETRSASP